MKSADEIVRDLPLSDDADLRARASVLMRLGTGLRKQRDDGAALGFDDAEREVLSRAVELLERAEGAMRDATGIARHMQGRRKRHLEEIRAALKARFDHLDMPDDQVAFIAFVYGDSLGGLDVGRAGDFAADVRQLAHAAIEQLARTLARVDVEQSASGVASGAWDRFAKVSARLKVRHAACVRRAAGDTR